MVPKRPLGGPRARTIESTRKLVVVLPLVPVMPTSCSFSAGRPKKFAAMIASALRASATRIQTTPGGTAGGFATLACEDDASHAGRWRRRQFAHDGRRAARNGVGDKLIAVGVFSVEWRRTTSPARPAAVVCDRRDFSVAAGRKFQRARTDAISPSASFRHLIQYRLLTHAWLNFSRVLAVAM